MTKRIRNAVLALGVVAALAVGGATLANAKSHHRAHKAQARTVRSVEAAAEHKAESTEKRGEAAKDAAGGHADAAGANVNHEFQGTE